MHRKTTFLLLFCASAWGLRGDTFSYDDSGRLSGAIQSNGLVHDYTTDAEGSLLTATTSATDTTAGGGLGNGIADWWENWYFGTTGIDPLGTSGDGVPFLMKFALGVDPSNPNFSGQLPEGVVEGSDMSLVFRKGKAATLTYVVQSSTDLVTWTNLTTETTAVLALPPLVGLSDQDSDSYKVSVPKPGNKFFMRLKVTNP
jgi:hypothetical protein